MVKHIGGVKDICDTQCGFKLFTREAARMTFSNLHIERWAFDVELLWLAQKQRIPIAEIKVSKKVQTKIHSFPGELARNRRVALGRGRY